MSNCLDNYFEKEAEVNAAYAEVSDFFKRMCSKHGCMLGKVTIECNKVAISVVGDVPYSLLKDISDQFSDDYDLAIKHHEYLKVLFIILESL